VPRWLFLSSICLRSWIFRKQCLARCWNLLCRIFPFGDSGSI